MSFYDTASLILIPSGVKVGKVYSAKPVPTFGAELITNGDFATDTDWTKGSGWTISGGTASAVSATGELSQTGIDFDTSKTYRIEYVISGYSGSGGVKARLKGAVWNTGILRNGNGSFTETITSTGENYVFAFVTSSSFSGSIDNVSVKEVLIGSGDFTFTRGSNLSATRVDASQLIEKGRENVFLNSVWDGVGTNVPPTSWANGFTTGNYEAATSSFIGNNAIRFYGTTERRFLFTSIGFSGIHSVSFYVESVVITQTISDIILQSNGTDILYLKDGVSVASSTAVVAGSYYTLVFNATGATEIRLGGGIRGNRTYDFTISVPQLEQGLTRTDYIETTTTTGKAGILENTPRLNYTTGVANPYLLLEPSRTNFVDSSEYAGGWAGISANITTTNNATTSPEGVDNAVKLEDITTASTNQIVNFGTTALNGINVVGKTYTGSIYIKPVNPSDVGKDIVLSIQRHSGDYEGISVAFEIDSADWKRYEMTYTFIGVGAGNQVGANLKILRGSTTIDDIYVYGVQLEEGSYPTSYIPSYGTTAGVTRVADVCYKTGITSLIGQTEGTLFGHLVFDSAESTNRILSITGTYWSDSNLRFDIISNQGRVTIRSAGVDIAKIYATGTISKGDEVKFAFVYTASSVKLFINGALRGSATPSASLPSTSELHIDALGGGFSSTSQNNQLNPYKQALVFKTALTDAEAITLTTL